MAKMQDFYFAYDYDPKKKTASRLYRFIGGLMERYNPESGEWETDGEQYCIFVGEDTFYDEITEDEAKSLTVMA